MPKPTTVIPLRLLTCGRLSNPGSGRITRGLGVLAALCACCLISGCTNLNKTIKELANDPATVKIRYVGVGVSFEFERSFPTNWVPSR